MALLFLGFIVLLMIGVPVGFALACIPLIDVLFFSRYSSMVIPHEMWKALDSFPIMAVPLFILAGNLMNSSKITHQLIKFSNSMVGHIRGGLAQVNIVVSMMFAGLNGSAIADTVSVGSVLIPAMKEEGYDAEFSAAITATSSMIGAIIPPSVAMVIYGSALGVSIGGLFAAGIIPGLLIGLALMILTYVLSKMRNYPVHSEKFTIKEFFNSLKVSILPLFLPVIIIAGIVFGVFTPTEAAGIAVAYSLFLGVVIYRNLSFHAFLDCLFRSGVTTGVILLIVGASAPFAWLVNILQVPKIITDLILELTSNKYLILIIFNIFLFLMGMALDATANILILGPILAPVAESLGIHPLHFGMIMIVNLIIGLGTPPVGTCLFAVVPLAGVSVERISKAILPFVAVQTVVLILITYFPKVVMYLPTVFGFVN